MRHQVALVKNVLNASDRMNELKDSNPETPKIAVLSGPTGNGKTTTVKFLAVREKGVYVRVLATSTPRSLLAAIMRELDADPLPSSAAMVEWVATKLNELGKPLFLDEADYLVNRKQLVETTRDIHDLSTQALILVGMADFRRHVTHRAQLAGRVSQWVDFKQADLDDAHLICKQLCEVRVDDELLERVHIAAQGSIRGIVVGLSRVETFAKKHQLDLVTSQRWGREDLVMPTGRA